MKKTLTIEQANVAAVAKAIRALNEEQREMLKAYYTEGKASVDEAIKTLDEAAKRRDDAKAERAAKGYDIASPLNGDKLHIAEYGKPLAAGYKLDEADWASKPSDSKNGASARFCHVWMTWRGKTNKGKRVLETLGDDEVFAVLLEANAAEGMSDNDLDALKVKIRKHIVAVKCGVFKRIKDLHAAWEWDNAAGRSIEGVDIIGIAKDKGKMTAGSITRYGKKA